MYKKTVIMSAIDQGKQKAVLNLEKNGIEINGYVRLYNFESEPKGILSLGILSDKKVKKVALNKKCDMQYTFSLDSGEDIGDFTCALVNIDEARVIPLLQGASKGQKVAEERLVGALSVFDVEPTVENITSVLDENEIELDNQQEVEAEVDEIINCQADDCSKCVECKYRSAFYGEGEQEGGNEAESDDFTFFDSIKDQIDSLFGKYPEEDFLNDIVPDSKWIKVDYEQNGEYYVVGLLYDDDKIKYVCYGVPGMYSQEPPTELNGFSQWLPLDSAKPEGFGYWITYQDAETGENVKIEYNIV